MKINRLILSLTLALLLSSCQHKSDNKHNNIKEETILIVYFTGDIETLSRITCKIMATNKYYKDIIADTIQISQYDFSRIKYFLRNQKNLKEESSCDSRIYLKMDSIDVCIGNNNCASNIDNASVGIDLKTIYMIKCKSGYYNYFSKEQLLYDESIIKYGIPKDYKYQRSAPNVKRKECVKIIMIEKHNR